MSLFMGCCSPQSKPGLIWAEISIRIDLARRTKKENPELWNCTEAAMLDRLIALDDLFESLGSIQGPGDSSDAFVKLQMQATLDATHKVGRFVTELLQDFDLNKPAMSYDNYGKPIKGAKPEDYAVGKPPEWPTID